MAVMGGSLGGERERERDMLGLIKNFRKIILLCYNGSSS